MIRVPVLADRLLLIAELRITAAARNIRTIAVRNGELLLSAERDSRALNAHRARLSEERPTRMLKEMIRIIRETDALPAGT